MNFKHCIILGITVVDSDGENVSELSDDDSSYDEIQQEIKENERKQLKDSLERLKAARQKKIQLSTEKKKKFSKKMCKSGRAHPVISHCSHLLLKK